MLESLLLDVSKISLIARIYKELQSSNTFNPPIYSEREILVLEVIGEFSPITESMIRKLLGLPASTVSEITKKLSNNGLINRIASPNGDGREKPIEINLPEGENLLKLSKSKIAKRLSYLFTNLDEQDINALAVLAKKVADNAMKTFDEEIINPKV